MEVYISEPGWNRAVAKRAPPSMIPLWLSATALSETFESFDEGKT